MSLEATKWAWSVTVPPMAKLVLLRLADMADKDGPVTRACATCLTPLGSLSGRSIGRCSFLRAWDSYPSNDGVADRRCIAWTLGGVRVSPLTQCQGRGVRVSGVTQCQG